VNLLDGVMFVRFLLRARIFVLCSEGISDAWVLIRLTRQA
jgi:hypothetical protein